jgi:Fic family protein
MEVQKNRYKKEEVIFQWVIFFLESMIELTKRLEAKYETYSKLKVLLNERQQQIVALIKRKETIQISEIEHVLEHYSRNTIKKDLIYLVNEAILLKTGKGRGVKYHFNR